MLGSLFNRKRSYVPGDTIKGKPEYMVTTTAPPVIGEIVVGTRWDIDRLSGKGVNPQPYWRTSTVMQIEKENKFEGKDRYKVATRNRVIGVIVEP